MFECMFKISIICVWYRSYTSVYIYIPVPPCMAQSPTNHSPKGTKLGQLEPQQEESKRFFAKGTHLKKNQLFLPEP